MQQYYWILLLRLNTNKDSFDWIIEIQSFFFVVSENYALDNVLLFVSENYALDNVLLFVFLYYFL